MASNFCRNCGFRITPGKSFCGNCGSIVTAAPAQVPTMPVAVPVVATPVLTPVYSVPAAAPVAAPAAPVVPLAPVAPAAAPVAVPMPTIPVQAPAAPAAPVAVPMPTVPVQAPAAPETVPVAAPVVADPAAPAPVTAAPVSVPDSPVPEAKAEPEAEPVISVNPQPMQTVVTYHPEESVTEQLPAEALLPAVPVQETVPEVVPAPASLAPVQEMVSVPAVPVAPADPSVAQVPAAAMPVAPAAPVTPNVPEATPAPKKKKHTGLIIGLICAGAAVILIGIAALIVVRSIAGSAKGGTILDRIEVLDEVSSGTGYTIYNKDFDKNIESARWWDYDGTMKSQGVYNADTKTLAFSVKVDEKTADKLYFAFYYSTDNDFDKEELEEPIYSDTIAPTYYKDGTAYYNIECDRSLKPGYYCVIVSNNKSLNKPYAVAYARIREED